MEAILRKHHAVKDAGVIGTPDPLAGELPTALVVKMDGVSVTEKELIDFVGSKVCTMFFKILKVFEHLKDK